MKEFSEDEKTIARNINKKYKWIARDDDGSLWVFVNKPKKVRGNWYESSVEANLLKAFRHMFSSIKCEDDKPTLIKDIYDPQILDDVERKYLKTILRPFHDEVEYIAKSEAYLANNGWCKKEYLFIKFRDGSFTFPSFDPGEMYSGMERNKEYTMDELGITYKGAES